MEPAMEPAIEPAMEPAMEAAVEPAMEPEAEIAPESEPAIDGEGTAPEPTPEGNGEPYFLFPQGPAPQTGMWAMGAVLAAAAILWTLVACTTYRRLRRFQAIALLMIWIVLTTRAVFFLTDPFHQTKRMPALLVAYLYGVGYPAFNAAVCATFLALFGTIDRVDGSGSAKALTKPTIRRITALGRNIKTLTTTAASSCSSPSGQRGGGGCGALPTKQPAVMVVAVPVTRARPWVTQRRVSIFLMTLCASELFVQIFSDTIRSGYGYDWPILVMCRIFFIVWGLLIAFGFGMYALRLQLVSKLAKGVVRLPIRVLAAFYASMFIALASSFLNGAALGIGYSVDTRESLITIALAEQALFLAQACAIGMIWLREPARSLLLTCCHSALPRGLCAHQTAASTDPAPNVDLDICLSSRSEMASGRCEMASGPSPPGRSLGRAQAATSQDFSPKPGVITAQSRLDLSSESKKQQLSSPQQVVTGDEEGGSTSDAEQAPTDDEDEHPSSSFTAEDVDLSCKQPTDRPTTSLDLADTVPHPSALPANSVSITLPAYEGSSPR